MTTQSKYKIKVIVANVNSIISNYKRTQLLDFLKKNKPDLMLINETKLNKRHTLFFENYNTVRVDRDAGNGGGGTAILVKKNIKHSQIHINGGSSILEKSIINIKLKNNNKLYIVSVYAKKGKQSEFIEELNQLFSQLALNNVSNYFMIAGDFNAKHTDWANSENNERGIALRSWLDDNDILYKLKLYGPDSPSYPRGGSFIDLVMADARIELQTNVDGNLNTLPLDSDHKAISACFSIHNDELELNSTENHSLNYNKADWKKFKITLTKAEIDIPNNRNLSINEINGFTDTLESLITDAMIKSIPKIKSSSSVDKYINSKIKKLQKHKNHVLSLIHRWEKKFLPIDSEIKFLKSLLRDLKIELKHEITRSMNDYWEKRVRSISHSNYKTFFPEINKVFRNKNQLEIPYLRVPEKNKNILDLADINSSNLIKDSNNNYIIQEVEQKLDVLGSHFALINDQNSKMGKPRLNEIIIRETDKIKKEIETDKENNFTICSFNDNNTADMPSEQPITQYYFTNTVAMTKKFKFLNNKKSSGIDGIPNIVLKQLPAKIIHMYTILFNNMINYSYFPQKWKEAKVISLPKKDKDKTLPVSYRPISLLPNIGKVYEMAINDIINSYCCENKLVPDNQFGFRAKHSTIHAINKLTSDINWALMNEDCLGACLVDLEKAFDTVWQEGLIFKLKKKNFPISLVKLIWNMIKDRSFVTSHFNTLSRKKFTLINGLQQGTINSPILFNIYTADLLRLFGPDNTKCSLIAYADDLIIYYAGREPETIKKNLQLAVNKIFDFYNTWKLKVNTDKCETILFRPSLKRARYPISRQYKNFFLKDENTGNKLICHKKVVRYLGIQLDERLLYDKHIDFQLAKTRKAFMSLGKLFYSKFLNSRVKIICYQALIRPILTYGCPIWYNISSSQMEQIRVFERRCLRACLGRYRSRESNYQKYLKNRVIYNLADISRFDNFIIKLIRNYFADASKIQENSLIFPLPYADDNYIKKNNGSWTCPSGGISLP